jgi:hypothetical protein
VKNDFLFGSTIKGLNPLQRAMIFTAKENFEEKIFLMVCEDSELL